jgi:cytochrome oxidase Cu insertion factor (SCO1/SenC/PrrC family)
MLITFLSSADGAPPGGMAEFTNDGQLIRVTKNPASAPYAYDVAVKPEINRMIPQAWRLLREEPERLGPALAADDEWTRRAPRGEIDHPARLHLIDARGRVREIYSLAFFDERQALLDIQALLRE